MAKRIDASKMELKEKVVEINRVTKTVKGGRNMRFAAFVVVGDARLPEPPADGLYDPGPRTSVGGSLGNGDRDGRPGYLLPTFFLTSSMLTPAIWAATRAVACSIWRESVSSARAILSSLTCFLRILTSSISSIVFTSMTVCLKCENPSWSSHL